MAANPNQISTGFFSLREEFKKAKSNWSWMLKIYRHRRQLDGLAEYAVLDCLWDLGELLTGDFRDPEKQSLPTLLLRYTGREPNFVEGRPRLDKIRAVLSIDRWDSHTYEATAEVRHPPGYLWGTGRLQDWLIRVRLQVPWLPKGCEVVNLTAREGGRRWHRQYEPTRYGVACDPKY